MVKDITIGELIEKLSKFDSSKIVLDNIDLNVSVKYIVVLN